MALSRVVDPYIYDNVGTATPTSKEKKISYRLIVIKFHPIYYPKPNYIHPHVPTSPLYFSSSALALRLSNQKPQYLETI